MVTILLVAAIVAAVAALGLRRMRNARARREVHRGPGTSAEEAIPIRSFEDMDAHLRRRRCACGSFLTLAGEGTRAAAGRRLRVARLACDDCDESLELYFDTSALLQ
ncbi:MAG: hypothetical protein AB1689_22440 [Thermodesulfobacteriota bacterium]